MTRIEKDHTSRRLKGFVRMFHSRKHDEECNINKTCEDVPDSISSSSVTDNKEDDNRNAPTEQEETSKSSLSGGGGIAEISWVPKEPITLHEKINEFVRRTIPYASESVVKTMQETTRTLVDKGITEDVVKKGEKAPSFELRDLNNTGKLVSSAELLGQNHGKMIVFFSHRGKGHSDNLNKQLMLYQDVLQDFEAAGATFLVVSSSNSSGSNVSESEQVHGLEVEYPVLRDVDYEVAKQFGLVYNLPEKLRDLYSHMGIHIPDKKKDSSTEDNNNDPWDIPLAATYVIDTDGTVLECFVNDADCTKQTHPSKVLAVLS